MKRGDVLGLIAWLLLAYATSALGAVASVNAADFYGQLVQPAWAPPPWLFGPCLLYTSDAADERVRV